MAEVERRAVLGPEFHVALIGADEQAEPFLAQIIFAVAVGDRRQPAAHGGDFGNGLGDEILVLGRDQRQLQAGHGGDLAAPQAGGVDHPLRADLARRRTHDPAAVGLSFRGDDRGEAMDLGATLARTGGVGGGDAGRVDIAAFGFIHDAAYAVEIDQRMQPLRLVARDLIKIHLVAPRLRFLQPQLMLARLGLGEIERARLEDAAALAGLGLQLLVERHCVMLQAADVGRVMQAMDVGGGVPGRAGGELVAFQEDDIGPAMLGQMI